MLKSCFAAPGDQERINATDHSTISHWSKLVENTSAQNQIKQVDIYSRDKRGFTMEKWAGREFSLQGIS